ncbi:MAG: MBL fold metallo-hydrolase [Gammaproteobacteria bacterium]
MKRRIGFAFALLVPALLVHACATRPVVERPVSDHFDGEVFSNYEPVERTFKQFINWMMNRNPGEWPEYQQRPPGPKPLQRVEGERLRVTMVGHSTLLVQTAGLNILTDPIWSDRASPVSFAGPHRVHPPGIAFEQLPPIDLVLVSHGHYDHMDIPTLKRLYERFQPRFLVGLGQGVYLQRAGIEAVTELDWWDEFSVAANHQPDKAATITAVPVRHWSARWIGDRNRALWVGFVIDAGSGPLFFAGDTGFGDHFRQIAERFGPPRLAMLPIGAYLPRHFMVQAHTSPGDALKVHQLMEAGTSVAMHFGTFRLGDDGETQAVEQLQKLIAETEKPLRPFLIPHFGEPIEIN